MSKARSSKWNRLMAETITQFARDAVRDAEQAATILTLLRGPCAVSKTLDVNDPDWKAFVEAARQRPEDDNPQLVFCDWLQEHYYGSSLEKMIRGMVAVARHDPKNAMTSFGWLRPKTVSARHFMDYDNAWHGFLRSWRYWPPFEGNEPHRMRQCLLHRGILLRVVCCQEYWHRVGDQVCSVSPVGEVVFVDDVDFFEHLGVSVVQVSPRNAALLKRLPHDPHNPHYTRVIDLTEWRRLDYTAHDELLNRIGCELYQTAWAGKVGRFRVETIRDRDNITVSPDDVPDWPPAIA